MVIDDNNDINDNNDNNDINDTNDNNDTNDTTNKNSPTMVEAVFISIAVLFLAHGTNGKSAPTLGLRLAYVTFIAT